MPKIIALYFLLLSGFFAQAQQEVSLPNMHDIPNSIRFNPAFTTGYKWTVSLPSFSNSLVSNAPALNSLFVDNGGGDYTLNVAQAISSLSAQNYLANVNKLELFGLSHQWKNSFLHFNVGVQTRFGLDFPKGLAQLAAYGNGPFVGETIDIGPALNVQSYTSLGLGYSHKFGKLRIGATVNYLNGIATVSSIRNDISLYTDPEYYQLTATSDYELVASSLVRIDSFGGLKVQFKDIKPTFIQNNKGIGYDLGLVFDLTKNLSFSASIIDLGKINWTENTNTLTSKGTYTFDGFPLDGGFASVDSSSLAGILDSVYAVFNFKSQNGVFSTPLARKILIGTTYKHGKSTTLSALVDATNFLDKNRLAFALSGRTYVMNWLALGGVISYKNNEIDHLGLNTTLKLGPVQLYLLSDNALSFIFPKTANDIHFRMGINIMMGQIDKVPSNAKSAPLPHL